MFQEELEFFIANQADLVDKYRGKVLVLRGSSVMGVYDSTLEAYLRGQEQCGPGAFMLQPCEPGPDAYSVNVSSTELVLA